MHKEREKRLYSREIEKLAWRAQLCGLSRWGVCTFVVVNILVVYIVEAARMMMGPPVYIPLCHAPTPAASFLINSPWPIVSSIYYSLDKTETLYIHTLEADIYVTIVYKAKRDTHTLITRTRANPIRPHYTYIFCNRVHSRNLLVPSSSFHCKHPARHEKIGVYVCLRIYKVNPSRREGQTISLCRAHSIYIYFLLGII